MKFSYFTNVQSFVQIYKINAHSVILIQLIIYSFLFMILHLRDVFHLTEFVADETVR